MDYSKEAEALLVEAREAKRTIHKERRRAHNALSKLDLLKKQCREFGIRLVIDGEVIVDGTDSKEVHSRDGSKGSS